MATFLDVTGLEQFSNFFVFIFVWLTAWAIFSYIDMFKGNKAISIILGFIIAIFVLISPTITGAIAYIAPWIALIFVFIMLLKTVMMSFGANSTEAFEPLKSVFIVIIIIALVVGMLSYIRERTSLPGEGDNPADYDFSKTSNLIFHPKVLGMIAIFTIAVFTIALMVGKAK